MTRGHFFHRSDGLCGFELRGHAGAGVAGEDIVCAAVSSAVYLTANTLTDVYHCAEVVEEQDALFSLRLKEDAPDEVRRCGAGLLEGFRLHLEGLACQYPSHIRVTITEV
ncbi:MAG: ribosomal-processing cysteine protease Prp [Clostridiales bacterium]|nr:ribosomal-processing cysteine protease Prp [Clostridiales bacterium]